MKHIYYTLKSAQLALLALCEKNSVFVECRP